MTSAVQDFRVDLSTRLSALSGVTVAMKMQITNKCIHFAKKKTKIKIKGCGQRDSAHGTSGYTFRSGIYPNIANTKSPNDSRIHIISPSDPSHAEKPQSL